MVHQRRIAMTEPKIERLRVEPISTYLESYRKNGQVYPVTIANGLVFLSGIPPFDPKTGEIKQLAYEQQCELVMAQLKTCLEAAGSSLTQVLKCNVYSTPGEKHFATFNAVYDRYFPKDAPSRIFMYIHSWPGSFDVEIDCVAAR
jgi:2-iminobutanoate/2-iminopropanoate deaminase